MKKQPEQHESANGALTFGERVFYIIASIVLFALSGLIVPSNGEMQLFTHTEQWELWHVGAVIFATAFFVGLHGLSPPYAKK